MNSLVVITPSLSNDYGQHYPRPCFLNTQCKHRGLIKALPTVKHNRRIEIKFARRISRYFSLSYHLQVSIGTSSTIAQSCRVYMQNIIDYTLKVNYIARNIITRIVTCGKHIMHLYAGDNVLVRLSIFY